MNKTDNDKILIRERIMNLIDKYEQKSIDVCSDAGYTIYQDVIDDLKEVLDENENHLDCNVETMNRIAELDLKIYKLKQMCKEQNTRENHSSALSIIDDELKSLIKERDHLQGLFWRNYYNMGT